MKTLFVPIQVDMLVAEQLVPIARQGADFSKMPYQDANNIDVRPGTANLASAIRYEAFNNTGYLKPGVHLHWALPDALTHGSAERQGQESDNNRICPLCQPLAGYLPQCERRDTAMDD